MGLSWIDVGLAVFLYFLTGLGVTIGFHRHFTHRAFKAVRRLRVGLAIAGSMAFQGPIIVWVADHRRHHTFADKDGDPHSPWVFGTTPAAVARGFWHAHMGWLFRLRPDQPHPLRPRPARRPRHPPYQRAVPSWSLITWSWWGALTGFFWAGLVRVAVLLHVTWSINSICHMIGNRPFTARDRSTNFWPLAIASMGESWHNLHHADPTCARHGVGRGQLDMSARIIAIFERPWRCGTSGRGAGAPTPGRRRRRPRGPARPASCP
jgi:stearoyl-CoA desaturase (Delta-9 desaturase)